jgi:hypothetical protein
MQHNPPELNKRSFTCPYCNTLAQQEWNINYIQPNDHKTFYFFESSSFRNKDATISLSTCQSCHRYHLWFDENLLIPNITAVPLPNEDMPEDIKKIYLEARDVVNKSAKAAAALLRLAVQHLCEHLGGEGKNINSDIGKFVKNGLDIRVQKALDIVRITGNNAVHPGTLDLDDNPDIAVRLFGLLNFIVDSMITQPKLIDSFFSELPSGAVEAIERRDRKE